MTGVLEHGQRLSAVIDEDLGLGQLVPREIGIGLAGGDEEAVLLIDLGEMQRRWLLALLERAEVLGDGRLRHVHAAIDKPGDGRFAGGRDRMLGLEAFLLEEAAGNGRDERTVERREARELDADRLGHCFAPTFVSALCRVLQRVC